MGRITGATIWHPSLLFFSAHRKALLCGVHRLPGGVATGVADYRNVRAIPGNQQDQLSLSHMHIRVTYAKIVHQYKMQ